MPTTDTFVVTAERNVPLGAPLLDAGGNLIGMTGGFESPTRNVGVNTSDAEILLTWRASDWSDPARAGIHVSAAVLWQLQSADPVNDPWIGIGGKFDPYSAVLVGEPIRGGGLVSIFGVASPGIKGGRVKFVMWREAGSLVVRCAVTVRLTDLT